MSIVVNSETGAVEDVKDPNTALAAGTHEVALVSPDGEHGSASIEDAARLIHEGYRQPSANEAKQLLKQSVYGTTGQMAKTALEGAAQGALGPVAPAAEKALGVNMQDMRNRQDVNPKTHIASEVAGLAGSVLAGVGEGALLEHAGAPAAALIERVAGKGALAKIGAGAARGAVENAVYAAGNEGTKAIMQDPEQSAQTAIADVGLSALFGGVVGGAFSAGGAAWDHFAEHKAQDFISGVQDKISEYTGKSANKSRGAIANFPDKAGLSKYVEQVDASMPAEMSAHSEARVAGAVRKDPFTGKVLERESSLAPVEAGRAKVDPFTKKPIEAAESNVIPMQPPSENHVFDPFKKKYIERPGVDAASMDAGKAVGESYVKDAVKKFLKENGAELAGFGLGEAFGDGHLGGFAGALFGRHAAGPVMHTILPAVTRALMEHPISGAGLKSAIEYGKAVLRGETLLNDAAKAVFTGSKIEVIKPNVEELDKKLEHLLAHPDDALKIGDNVGHYMAGQSMALASTAANTARYLQSLRPDTTRLGALDAPRVPNSAEVAKYNQALAIAQAPATLIMQKIQQGRLQLDDIHHMQNMYPALYKSMQAKLIKEMINHTSDGKAVPYATRMSLSAFMGQPLDATMHPTYIQAAQPQMQGGANEAQQRQPHKVEKLDKLAGSYMSPEQSLNSRKQKV